MNNVKVFSNSGVTFKHLSIGDMFYVMYEHDRGVFMKTPVVTSNNPDTMDWERNCVQLSTGMLWTIDDEDKVEVVHKVEICGGETA